MKITKSKVEIKLEEERMISNQFSKYYAEMDTIKGRSKIKTLMSLDNVTKRTCMNEDIWYGRSAM